MALTEMISNRLPFVAEPKLARQRVHAGAAPPANLLARITVSKCARFAGLFAILLALIAACAPSAWGQCTPQLVSFTLDKSTLLSDGQDQISATVQVSQCPDVIFPTLYTRSEFGLVITPSNVGLVGPSYTTGSFITRPRYLVATPLTETVTASLAPGGAGISQGITLLPLSPTLTVSPGTLTNGTGQTATGTIDTGVPVFGDATLFAVSSSSSAVLVVNLVSIPSGQSSATFQVNQGFAVAGPTNVTITASMYWVQFGTTAATATVTVLPAGSPSPVKPADQGPCKHCVG